MGAVFTKISSRKKTVRAITMYGSKKSKTTRVTRATTRIATLQRGETMEVVETLEQKAEMRLRRPMVRKKRVVASSKAKRNARQSQSYLHTRVKIFIGSI